MVRFTLHRPSQNSAVSTCCDAMSCRDVSGRVQLGVRPVPARSAHEPRLALATARSDVRAGLPVADVYAAVTFSTRPGAFCSHRAASRPHPNVRMPQLRPVFCVTFLPGFCTVPRAERVMALTLRYSTPNTSNLRARPVLCLLHPVLAPVAAGGLQAGDQGLHLAAAIGPAGGPGKPALQPQEPLSFLHAAPGRTGQLTRGQRHRNRHTPNHADDDAGPRCGDRFGNHGERDMPTTSPVGCAAVRRPPRQRAAAFELHPTDLGDQHTRSCAVVLSDPQPPEAR